MDGFERAVYYARVIEIPTLAWPDYDAEFFELELDPQVELTTQERASGTRREVEDK